MRQRKVTIAPRVKPASPMKTFSHLADSRKMPTQYELVTSKLLYHMDRGGFAVSSPVNDWYAKHLRESPLQCSHWEGFVDPRETTYARYVQLQRMNETYVDGVLEFIESSEHDRGLNQDCVALLNQTLPVLRYPMHGLHMLAAYVGQMSPAGRITIAAALQSADELRRIQRMAYRMTQLGKVHTGFGAHAKDIWLTDPTWQPMRKGIELALVAYDFGESLVALNFCLKPLFDELFLVHWPEAVASAGDQTLGMMTKSLCDDSEWHRAWTRSLSRWLIGDRPQNQVVLKEWTDKWSNVALNAVESIDEKLLGGSFGRKMREAHSCYLTELGLPV